MRTGIAAATDNGGPFGRAAPEPTRSPAKPPARAGGFGYSVIETLLVAGERLVGSR
jgi:hypothetical protein